MGMGAYDEEEDNDDFDLDLDEVTKDEEGLEDKRVEGEVEFEHTSVDEMMKNYKNEDEEQ